MILPRSLQGRLLVLVIGGVIGVWLITALFIWRDARRELDELLDSHLAQAAALLIVQQTQSMDDDDGEVDTRVPHPYAPKVAFQIFHEGQAVVRSANAPAEPMISANGEFGQGFATVQINGDAWRVFSVPGTRKETRIYVGERIDSRTAILLAVLRGTLWPMAAALPLLGFATWWAVRQGVTPLKKLGRSIARRGPDDLAPVVMTKTPAEMSPVLDALNQLFERIQTVRDAERRFTDDAAHELRTPIAAIRSQAQVALAETDDRLRQHALRATLEGCDRATRLVNQLLVLSRLDSGATLEFTKLDLSALAQRVAAELAPTAIAKRQSLEFDGERPCHVTGDETLLAALVRNLVDNAIRYSPPGASVLIKTAIDDTKALLIVEDSGPGLADADRPRLGERFFRVRGTTESGSGLGWSIVQRIVALHAATVNVRRSKRLGGLEVEVTLHAGNA
ncbi:sensor histidine kinase N-terminal domain-containing protein [Paraburkholderia sp. LEh10]|uniref:ATP-binding protein n=1 Tax=Paraburkholderia sp. LEh10 TaxID=2821353 RepID=UPI001AE96DCC|nr:ATP-binding protein [Paraburkholderia sp. LEh10]MBP0593392.1 sensor histidine kinase N-terminal domain-containing protein [Paraburkholderia sp. LEh10]